MNNSARITGFTIRDQMRQKSLYLFLGIAIALLLMLRGCYEGRVVVNGQLLDRPMVVSYVSKMAFQLTAAGMFLVAAMLAMRIFSRDRADGSMVLFLSRPVSRRQYVLGRIVGTWLISFLCMFILHLAIALTVWTKTGTFVAGYLTASLLSSVNLLFVVVCVCLLSLYVPDFLSVVFTAMIVLIGFISDGAYQIMQSDLAQALVSSAAQPAPALWRVVYPKIFMVQSYADAVIAAGGFGSMGPLNPVLNVALFVLLLTGLTLIGFNSKEI